MTKIHTNTCANACSAFLPPLYHDFTSRTVSFIWCLNVGDKPTPVPKVWPDYWKSVKFFPELGALGCWWICKFRSDGLKLNIKDPKVNFDLIHWSKDSSPVSANLFAWSPWSGDFSAFDWLKLWLEWKLRAEPLRVISSLIISTY